MEVQDESSDSLQRSNVPRTEQEHRGGSQIIDGSNDKLDGNAHIISKNGLQKRDRKSMGYW